MTNALDVASNIRAEIVIHLSQLSDELKRYFPDIDNTRDGWIRNPFVVTNESINSSSSIKQQESLLEISVDETLQTDLKKMALIDFWAARQEVYRKLSQSYKYAAIPVLEADDLNSLLEQFKAIPVVKEPTIKLDNHVKKKSRKDAEISVLEADDLNSLLELFEAIPVVKEPTTKLDNLMKIESRKDAKISVLHSKYLNSFIKKIKPTKNQD
ncbi:unnamed protein product [Arctia plantaginis]|uniref:Uncharacterized protein n=1 Tax=Arctia plantaginis TaxID=874455 RepID=A0A8S0ZI30_ARCPL|nr:unnamed protein product [Arctia plantaginis]